MKVSATVGSEFWGGGRGLGAWTVLGWQADRADGQRISQQIVEDDKTLHCKMAGRGGVARKQWQMTGKESVTMGQWQMTGHDGVARNTGR